MPQNNQQCGLWAAVAKNGQAIVGDGIGLGASFLPAGKPAVALIGLAIGSGVLANSAYTSDRERPALSLGSISLGIAGIHLTSTGPLAKGLEATSAIARNLPVTGQILAGAALAIDAVNVYKDYKPCQ